MATVYTEVEVDVDLDDFDDEHYCNPFVYDIPLLILTCAITALITVAITFSIIWHCSKYHYNTDYYCN